METFKAAHDRIFAELGQAGWTLSSTYLKVRHATSPDGRVRVWFKPQALWVSEGKHTVGEARSMHVEARGLPTATVIRLAGMTPTQAATA